jgi:SAM-dependent methyltransferase
MSYLTINQGNSSVALNWKDPKELREWASWQAGKAFYPNSMSDEEFRVKFNHRSQWHWNRTASLVDMTSAKRIVDVGSGVAVQDLIASKLNPSAEFYLVDKSENTRKSNGLYYQEVHGHYNAWSVVEDAIKESDIDRSKFNFLSPDDAWPDDIDVVISTYSWCWHYPKEAYWDKVISKLKVGGTLALDIFYLPNRDTVSEISEAMGSTPQLIKASNNTHLDHFKDQFVLKDNAPGGFHVWKRAK